MYNGSYILYKRRLREGSRRKILYRKFLPLYNGNVRLYSGWKFLYRFSLREPGTRHRYTGSANFYTNGCLYQSPGRRRYTGWL